MGALQLKESDEVPDTLEDNVVLILMPQYDAASYRKRTDRNIGWITRKERAMLRKKCVVGIAGCGGMGGFLAAICIRLGIGELRIADPEVFDVSNLNRQFAAYRDTIGKSKALATAREIRRIASDTKILVYPQGINDDTVASFVEGCDVILDEVEAFAIYARVLLHVTARSRGIPLFNCNTVGMGTNLFLYTRQSMTMEEALGISLDEARTLSKEAEGGDRSARIRIGRAMVRAVLPKTPRYREDGKDELAFFRRMYEEGKVPILATNPPLASGFLADRLLCELLKKSSVRRRICEVPVMPGYLHFDAAHMIAEVVTDGGWINGR